jgi:hypothetical protein
LKTLILILTHACSFMSYWSGLYGAELQDKLLEGIKVMMGLLAG